jgi:hypothetical protein
MKIQYIVTNWFPKALAVLYILFIALLSFDVFIMNVSLVEKMGGFVIENIPTILLLIALSFAWKKPIAGGVMFLVMSILFTLFFRTYQRWDTFFLISVPLLLIGGLFLLNKNEYN